MNKPDLAFWEQAEVVERFAARKPDHRLQELMQSLNPRELSVLDIGCAAGRNTVCLAELGANIHALDASKAMLAKTQERLAAILGQKESAKRVHLGSMDNLSMFADGRFDLVLGLGVYQDAPSQTVWEKALQESARVLKKGALCLVANFGPDSQPHNQALQKLPDTAHQYSGFARDGRIVTLMSAEVLDSSFAKVGLVPLKQTYTVKTEFEEGFRTTVNALYKKA